MGDSCRVSLASLDNFGLAVARFDRAGVLTYQNAAAARLLGVPPDTYVDISMLFPNEAMRTRVRAEIRERMKGKCANYRTAFHPPCAGGEASDIPVSVFAFPDSDTEGEVLGSITLIQDLREDVLRERIHKAIEENADNQTMFRELSSHLALLFDFDELRVVTISNSRVHLRRLFTSNDLANARYPFRWWPMPPFLQETLHEWQPTIMETDEMLADPNYRELLERDDATRAFFESGVRQILSVPIYDDNHIVAFFSLDSCVGGRYNEESLKLLQRLPIAQAVLAAIHREQRDLQNHKSKLLCDISAKSTNVRSVAQELVQRLVNDFGWAHVSIFQCDSARCQFRLVFQSNMSDSPVLPKAFEISGDSASSAIIEAATTESLVSVTTTRARGALAAQQGFKPAGSQLALPIKGRNILWILNIESTYENAFSTEEIDLLQTLASEIGKVLRLSTMFEMQSAVLGSINDAVIETSETGLVRWSNHAAHMQFGLDNDARDHACIFDLIVDPAIRDKVRTSKYFEYVHLDMHGVGGRQVPVLMSGTMLPSHLNGRVYVITDFTYQKEVQRLTELKDVFRQAAFEGRVPLSLASVWLKQLADEHPALRESVDKIAAQLKRADLPLERLLRLFSAEATPAADPRADMNLALRMTLAELPHSLLNEVDSSISTVPLPVAVSFDDLQFCVESMISFGLRTRPQSKKLRVCSELDDVNAVFSVQGDWSPDMSSDQPLGPAEQTRRKSLSDLALGQSVIERIIDGGRGYYEWGLDGVLCLRFSLPLRVQ